MRTLRLWMVVFGVVLLGACGTDSPEGKDPTCTLDVDCDAGFYCGAGNKCLRDCTTGSECEAGEVCNAQGRCVVGGECGFDADCDSPPETKTCEGNVAVTFGSPGTCVSEGAVKACEYSEVRTTCEDTCNNGVCTDACDNVFCTDPPLAECAPDGMSRTVYQSPGTCALGACDYQMTTEACALGCANGVCNSGTCDGVDCTMPPADTCDKNTALTYAATGTCDDSTGAPVCYYPITYDACDYTRATCNNAVCENAAPQVGGVAIVEYMANPADSFDDNEWFEIVNISGAAIDLTGWTIRSGKRGGEETFVIADNPQTTVPAFADGATLLLAKNPAAAGPVMVDYVYTGIKLANNGDFIELLNVAGEIVDRVYYESGAVLAGRSRKFNPVNAPSVSDNDDFTKWCPSMSDEYAPGSFGTPGQPNTGCMADACQGFTCVEPQPFCLDLGEAVQFMATNVMCEVTRFNNPYCDYDATNVMCAAGELCSVGACETIPANLPAAGEVIFTEFMGNPSAVSDSNGEWFELFNTTQGDLPLFSLVFKDSDVGGSADAWTIVDANATIPAGGYVVLAKNTDMATNGGVMAAGEFRGSFMKNTNIATDFVLSLERQDGVVVDAAFYNGVNGTNDVPVGASIQLGSGTLDAASNDVRTHWCEATLAYGDGDKGTPGAANETCD